MANGFKFSLEKLLEMRKTREEEGKKLFNNSQQELQKSINKLNDLMISINNIMELQQEKLLYIKN